MLFTITRDQYQKYGDTAVRCRQYILDKYSKLCEVVDIFNRYFTAERVDIYGTEFMDESLLLYVLEGYEANSEDMSVDEYLDHTFGSIEDERTGIFRGLSIYVYWPTVTVTNERGQSVDIQDLYAKIPICPDGRLGGNFLLTRSTYPYVQYASGYMHSHVNGINSDPSCFMHPCLGSGPLNRTQATLASHESHDNLWDLFCAELDRYVHVESMEGIPYRYLDRIGVDLNQRRVNQLELGGYKNLSFRDINQAPNIKELFVQFFTYILIRKKMRFAYSNGMYVSAYNDIEWITKLSKEFLKFFSMKKALGETISASILISKKLLIDVKISNGKFFVIESSRRGTGGIIDYSYFNGSHVLYFKGEDIVAHVNDPVDYNENTYLVLNPVVALTFLDQCLNYLNIYEHEKRKNVIQEESQSIIRDTNGSSTRSAGKNTFVNYPIGEKRVSISI